MMKARTMVLAVLVAAPVVFAGCGEATKTAEPAGTAATTAPTEMQETVAPEPDASYTSNCSYLLGDFTNGPSGFRFVADAQVTNTGNIGVIVELQASWRQAGGTSIKKSRRLIVPIGSTLDVGVVRRVTRDAIDQIQSVSGDNCKAVVEVVDTIGDAR